MHRMIHARSEKKIEVYNFVGGTVVGSSVVFFLGVGNGLNTGWEERTPVGMVPWVTLVEYLGDSNGMRGRL